MLVQSILYRLSLEQDCNGCRTLPEGVSAVWIRLLGDFILRRKLSNSATKSVLVHNKAARTSIPTIGFDPLCVEFGTGTVPTRGDARLEKNAATSIPTSWVSASEIYKPCPLPLCLGSHSRLWYIQPKPHPEMENTHGEVLCDVAKDVSPNVLPCFSLCSTYLHKRTLDFLALRVFSTLFFSLL